MGKVTIKRFGRPGKYSYVVNLDGKGVYGPYNDKNYAERMANEVRQTVQNYKKRGIESSGGSFSKVHWKHATPPFKLIGSPGSRHWIDRHGNDIFWHGYESGIAQKYLQSKTVYAKDGYHGVVDHPTKFVIGEGKYPERVNITPIKPGHKAKHHSVLDLIKTGHISTNVKIHQSGLSLGDTHIGNIKIKKFI